MKDSKSKSWYKWTPLLPIFLCIFLVAPSYIGILSSLSNSHDSYDTKFVPKVDEIFSNINLKYKDKFLPSEYKLDEFVSTTDSIDLSLLSKVGITLKKPLIDNNISSVYIDNPDDEKGTADLYIKFEKKYKPIIIHVTGFLTTKNSLSVKIDNDSFKDSKGERIYVVPSYFQHNPNYLKQFISLNDQEINKNDITIDYLYIDDNSGKFIASFNYKEKTFSKLLYSTNTQTLLNGINISIRPEISKQDAKQITTNFNTFEKVYDTNKLTNYKWVDELLLFDFSFNDIKSKVTLSYHTTVKHLM